MAQDKKTGTNANAQTISAAPPISLPKGGGAIRGMGEKFAANPVTGTGSITIPIGVSPARSAFSPQLSLSYDSGSGNGPFGFGWSLSLPSITRKTDKGLPQYLDAEESDVFILSGSEDLVPVFRKNAEGDWVTDERGRPLLEERVRDGYRVRRYRPRIEGLFARIERWTNEADPSDVHWRSFSRDNILTIYGKDDNSRVADPVDTTRIFSWLICETRDYKGNAVLYEYKTEDGAGADLARAHQRNRGDRDDPRRTVNRYPKRIRYGNREPLFDDEGKRPRVLTDEQIQGAGWMFEVVFDYGEHDADRPSPGDDGPWSYRSDAFSSYRAGFEVRTCRLCQRVLMFHHFADEPGVGNDCLVRSTDFGYSHEESPDDARNPVYTFLVGITQAGYKRNNGGYLKRSLPRVEFEYTRPIVQEIVEDVSAESLENLPAGLDGAAYRWTDLHGEGIPGILTEQGGVWFYKRNLSPINLVPDGDLGKTAAKFAPVELVDLKPNLNLADAQLMDLAGDGQPDLVTLNGPMPGLYEHDDGEGWWPFRSFTSPLNCETGDPNLRLIDLDGDGLADVLITEDAAFVWHQSFGERGFGPGNRVYHSLDEEKGPRLVFAERSQSVYLADLSGDGLTDLVRIRNGEICYWPNLGYGRFGPKVTMDNAPHFDSDGHFDPGRVRLADIDGSGTTDIIYLRADGVRLYFNQCGNSWSAPQILSVFPQVDNLTAVTPSDLLGNGTMCLVWSSPLTHDAQRQMRYVDLMGGQKPHLLIRMANNLGAETRVQYGPSTKFYLQDKVDGRPWITRLPFPVHVVERVDTYDHISRNRFSTRYAYHHGYFDGEEREFRGFGMVEQRDTEAFESIAPGVMAEATNLDAASHVPPVLTRTWFHTGVYIGRDHVSDFFAGLVGPDDKGEYYREPGLTDEQARTLLLPDTVLPSGLTIEEEREACRALKGAMLRREVYALDSSARAEHPYAVTEQNFTIRHLQPRGRDRHAVFFVHTHEAINYSYERNPADPRISHAMTLEVDDYGNALKEVAIGYGRRQPDPELELQTDRDKQTQTLISYIENLVTNPIDDAGFPDDYRLPLAAETRTYELTGYAPSGAAGRFQDTDFVEPDPDEDTRLIHIFDEEIDYEDVASHGKQRRLIEQVRTLYRPDDLGEGQNDPLTLLSLGTAEPLAVPGESYKLAFTPGLLEHVFQRHGQPLIPNQAGVLGGGGPGGGGYVRSQELKADGRFPGTDPDDHWWIPTGRVFLSPNPNDSAAQELAEAEQHFFLPRRYRDPFHTDAVPTETVVTYDVYDLLRVDSRDPVGNRMTVGERLVNGEIDETKPGNDYRLLQPRLLMDPNRNRAAVAFDALGMVVGTALMGKPEENQGDSLDGFDADLSEAIILDHVANPLDNPHVILEQATSRLVYDVFAFQRTRNDPQPRPGVVYAIVRETHDFDLEPGQQTRIQHSFSYSDGFGREIQKKIQAEPERINGVAGSPRWVGSGWTIFNNKGKPVRQYEQFFSATHNFEFGVEAGVSPILFYDPVGRIVATLHPNHTYEKVVFDAWRQLTYDVHDTITGRGSQTGDARSDPDIQGYMAGYFAGQPADWQTWHAQRQGAAMGADEHIAAGKAAVHADTPAIAYLDTLGRAFLTVALNRFDRDGETDEENYATRLEMDIEGNERLVRDAIVQNGDAQGRIVMRYDYNMLGNRIHQSSMEAGERWILNDVAAKPIRAWDSRGHAFRSEYDPLRRPLRSFVTGADPANPNDELLTERMLYGEQHPEDELRNLRGRLYLHLSQAGAVANEGLDFKGNPLQSSRRLGRDYKNAVNWSAVDAAIPDNSTAKLDSDVLEDALAVNLEGDIFTSSVVFDALNRPMLLTTPHTPAMRPNVIRISYNEANLLDQVDANVRGALASGEPVWTPFVNNIDYNAKGQRVRIDYGNGASTFYEYDPLTFRIVHLTTRRNAVAFPDDCPQPPPAAWPGCQVQNLHYTYDAIGNITRIRDDAQQTIYFRNRRVEPSADYTYDALYRLIEAIGREHLGQIGGAPIPHAHNDSPRVGIEWAANDGNAMGTYTERYVYDAIGNILEMQHRGNDPLNAGWTRAYTYDEPSLLEPAKQNNRLSSTTVGDNNPPVERYIYDAHGNVTRMPHLGGAHPAPNMYWDYRDQLIRTDQGGGGTTYFVYDSAGQRVRKVWEKSANLIEERLYFGGFEIFRRRDGAGAVVLERDTLHIMDDRQRIALVETRTIDAAGDDPAPAQLIRYQLGNQLGSANLELDGDAGIISYEEYTPYGSTSYQAVRSQTETPKRYRYTGKERDEETGLYYHGARYYAPWLTKWASPDPAGLVDGSNLYRYVHNRPTMLADPGGKQGELLLPILLTPEGREFAAGVFEGQVETIVGLGREGVARIERTAEEIADNPIPYVITAATSGPTTALTVASTKAEVEHIADRIGEAAEAEGGGPRGYYVAVNQVLNPAYGIFEHGDEFITALSEGNFREAGAAAHRTVLSAVQTYLLADGVARVVTSRTPTTRVPPPARTLVEEGEGGAGSTGRTGQRPAVVPPRPTSEITTLTNVQAEIAAADVLPQYAPGSGFSGAYNPATGQWVAVASGENSALLSGRPVQTVPQFGGHAAAENLLTERTGVTDVSGNVGFTLIKGEGNTLTIRWNSGQINLRNFGDRAAPAEFRAAIREAIQRETGFEVTE